MDTAGLHPRGLIQTDQLPAFRKKLEKEPFCSMIRALSSEIEKLFKQPADASGELARLQATLYLCTGDEDLAWKALQNIKPMLEDDRIFLQSFSKGLSRARQTLNLAITYDLCCMAWTLQDKHLISSVLKEAAYRLAASMGEGGNYHIANNWNGVRWGTVAFAGLVSDDPESRHLVYEARLRLVDHLKANLSAKGWNPEGIGYFVYPWTYIGPALIAFHLCEKFDLIMEVPAAAVSFWHTLAGTVAVERIGGVGLRADLSDDHPNYISMGTLGLAFRLAKNDHIPALKWMFDHLCGLQGDQTFDAEGGGILFNLLYYPEDLEARNPAEIMGLAHVDEGHGAIIFRNRFQDNQDVAAVYCACSRRPRGAHNGPDTQAVRLQGLGNMWIVGGGRTGNPDGQSVVFPETAETQIPDGLGKLMHWSVDHDGSGYAIGTGSCVGVQEHKRWMAVDYGGTSGSSVLMIIADRSQNGRRWRLNTPEFNSIHYDSTGFTIIAPDQATLRATVLGVQEPLQFSKGIVERGGGAGHVGFPFKGVKYIHNHWIEFQIEGSTVVVITLQKSGSDHPKVSCGQSPWHKPIQIGGQSVRILEERVLFAR